MQSRYGKISNFSIILLFFFASPSFCTNCTNVLTVESEGLLNYLANVTFAAPHNLTGEWVMDMETDVQYTFLGGWGIWIRNDPSKGKAQFRSKRDDLEIVKGDIVSFRFRISWFTGEPKPEVISLIWDGVQLCADNGRSIKEIKASRARRTLGNVHHRMRMPVNWICILEQCERLTYHMLQQLVENYHWPFPLG